MAEQFGRLDVPALIGSEPRSSFAPAPSARLPARCSATNSNGSFICRRAAPPGPRYLVNIPTFA